MWFIHLRDNDLFFVRSNLNAQITAAGIPDFRSPGSGLYANIMRKYQLADPQMMFEIGFFKSRPEPFYSLAKELFPHELHPTPSHHFVRLLHNKGYLLRHYTQVWTDRFICKQNSSLNTMHLSENLNAQISHRIIAWYFAKNRILTVWKDWQKFQEERLLKHMGPFILHIV